jgi:hypothetical protein
MRDTPAVPNLLTSVTARGLVALEDGLGLQVVIGHPGLDSAVAELVLLRYAAIATGVDLESVEVEGTGASSER